MDAARLYPVAFLLLTAKCDLPVGRKNSHRERLFRRVCGGRRAFTLSGVTREIFPRVKGLSPVRVVSRGAAAVLDGEVS